MNDIENLEGKVRDKNVLITDTYVNGSFGFYLAHVLRNSARRTYCVDSRYKMTGELLGYRIIEEGKVVLVKGDIVDDREKTMERIKSVYGDEIDIEINMECKEK